MTAPGPITDTPILDGVLGDRLESARRAVDRAEQDARDFRAALTAGATAALEQQAGQRAQALLAERTAVLAARTSALESQLRRTEDLLETRTRELAELRSAPEVAAEAAAVPESEVVQAPVPAAPAVPPAPAPGRVTVARQARRGDDGPAPADVPSVPSMKDIFASTRAAGWLSDLRASKRPV